MTQQMRVEGRDTSLQDQHLAAIALGRDVLQGRPVLLDSGAGAYSGLAVRFTRPATGQRTKLWEISDSFHCSIIGTCLTAAELRKIMARVLQRDVSASSDPSLTARRLPCAASTTRARKRCRRRSISATTASSTASPSCGARTPS